MKVGIVCPYSWDVPGGVQFHVRDLAEVLQGRGHTVSVLAPADDDTPLPPYVVPAGRAVPVRYNGSVARVNFGPLSAARVRRWLREGGFDVLHIHEPATPSLALLACWAATGAIVATFHTSNLRSRAMSAAYPILEPALEKIGARVAVSEDARRTLVEHVGGDAVLIPNGVFVDRFAAASPREEWRGEGGTVGFIGRLDEARKGLPTLLAAMTEVVAARPGVRLLVAGRGDEEEAVEDLSPVVREAVTFLGVVDEQDKARLLRTVDVYVAPNIGGRASGSSWSRRCRRAHRCSPPTWTRSAGSSTTAGWARPSRPVTPQPSPGRCSTCSTTRPAGRGCRPPGRSGCAATTGRRSATS